MKNKFWTNKRVLITGNTGFKGSWLSLVLKSFGADVFGYALQPPTAPSLYEVCCLNKSVQTVIGDIRDFKHLSEAIKLYSPEIVFHLAAQPLVLRSYASPSETYETNVMGTVNVLEAVRQSESVKAVVNVTTDKCYQNDEKNKPFTENDPMGGYDPYSSSKACSELITSAYRNSFLNDKKIWLASARAGNVIGGGDWAENRLVPDIIRAMLSQKKVHIRSPYAVRPWQHVLEPLSGYIMLAEKLFAFGDKYTGGWNFGPSAEDAKNVEWIVKRIFEKTKLSSAGFEIETGNHPHEAGLLRLDSSKAENQLGWKPRWNAATAVDNTLSWTEAYVAGKNMYDVCLSQIGEYYND